ncbi:MAG: myo-inositol 2-dehydrogenase [Peptococcaceae bacterium BICA1-7]|nr:MAG: myo-inositol 2-dehydrogenase [Peptococcaceae bacterium BICA1-7]
MDNQLLLVGSGPMAIEYAKVLNALKVSYTVIGRGDESSLKFRQETGVSVIKGGIEKWLEKEREREYPQKAIVCVGEEALGRVTRLLIKKGVRSILVEKPGGLTSEDIRLVAEETDKEGAKVYVGYNRRFYASTAKALEIIEEDGGVLSFSFEFTEWSHVISGLKKAEGVLEEWFLANSTHVIDLAFFLGGMPKEIACFTTGGLEWHPSASIFTGAGISEKGALFSYQANWESPGRWGVEVLTKKHRLIFRPLEKLQVQRIGSVGIEAVEIDEEIDTKYKAGLFKQVESFLGSEKRGLPSIYEQIKVLDFFEKVSGKTKKKKISQF